MKVSIKNLFTNSSYLFASGIGNMILNMFQSIVVARGLGISKLGTWAIVVSSCSLIQSFLSFRTQEPLTKYLIEFKHNQEYSKVKRLLATGIQTDIITNILSLILVIFLSPILAKNLNSGSSILLFFYGSSFIFRSLDKTWFCIARDQKKLGKQSIKQFAITFFRFIVVFGLYVSGQLDLYRLAYVIFGSSFLSGLIIWILLNEELIKAYDLRISDLVQQSYLTSFAELNGFWSFMKATFLSNIFSSIIKNSDILILGYYRDSEEVGIYQVAKSLSNIGRLSIQSFASTVYQELNELISSGHIKQISHEIFRIMKFSFFKFSLIAIALIILMHPFLNYFYGNSYLSAYPLFLILFIGIFFGINLFWAQPLVLALDFYRYNLNVIVIAGIINLLCMVLLTPFFGVKVLAFINSLTTLSMYLALATKGLNALKKTNSNN